MSRTLLFLVLGLCCGIGVFLAREPDLDGLLTEEVPAVQAVAQGVSDELLAQVADHAQLILAMGPTEWWLKQGHRLERERQASGTMFFVFSRDSLICWTGQLPLPSPPLARFTGSHLVVGRSVLLHAGAARNGLSVHGLRPFWVAPPLENRYLHQGFHPSLGLGDGFRGDPADGAGPAVLDHDGRAMLRLGLNEGAWEMGSWVHWRSLFILLTALFLIGAAWSQCQRIVDSGRPVAGLALFFVTIIGGRWITLAVGPVAPMDRLPLFDPAVYAASAAFPSLGDLLINALLLVLLSVFLVRALRLVVPRRNSLLALLLWSAILGLAAWVTQLCIGLVEDSSVDLDLYRVQSLGLYGVLGLVSMALLLGAWAFTAWVFVRLARATTSVNQFLGTGLLSLALSILLHHSFGVADTILFLWPVPLLALVVIPTRSPDFLRWTLALCFLAGFSSHVLTKFTQRREQRERTVLAERLAVREDPVVEQLFRSTAPSVRRDGDLYRMLSGDAPCAPGELDERVRQRYFGGYWERYDVRLFGFDASGQVRCATDPDPPRSFSAQPGGLNDPLAVADMPDLFIEERLGGSFYHARIAVMPADDVPPAQLIVELHPRSLAQGLGFPALLLSGDDPLARRTERYAHARYMEGQLMERSGSQAQPQHWSRQLDKDGTLWFTEKGYEYLAKGDASATVIVLGLPERGFLDRATTFSYVFALFGILLVIGLTTVAMANGSLLTMGIGTKVRSALILFAVTALLFFGYGAQRLLAGQYAQRSEAAILEKARSVQRELARRLSGEQVLDESHVGYLEHLLGQLSNVFFTDITVYTTHGDLLSSSRPQVFTSGLLGTHMDPVAYRQVALRGMSELVHEESIGDAHYRTAYVPLLDRSGSALAYIALPTFADQRQQEDERSEVLVAVVNLFVLFFALGVFLAIIISNWTTRPLYVLKNALSHVGLQGVNEPIRYRGDDEVGQLVEVYNRKVEELRASAEKLARSERESAWREMARQVAHEIKNPLTPMKLSIQHFQRTWSPDLPDAAERMERFSQGMVQQIDALSAIAGEFSNFAQMPRANPERLVLAEVIRAATGLFHSAPGVEVTFKDATSQLVVNADREQLLRVFNNLLKNALQSIPAEHEGKVVVTLRHEAGNAIVEVQDNGTGIIEEDRERIFQPNFTTKTSGMGLGLAMVQRIVENAGGKVWFTTRIGEGTTFFVSLPLAG